MDSFENLIALLLRHEGWWTTTSYRVRLTKADKEAMGTKSTPRWEIDVLAYKGSTNEVLVVECKSWLNSRGVVFRNGAFEPPKRFKMLAFEKARRVVLRRLVRQLVKDGACGKKPNVRLALAAARIANVTDRPGLQAHLDKHKWLLFDEHWVRGRLACLGEGPYENEVAVVVAKLLAER